MMKVRAKGIYIFIIKVNKLFSFSFFLVAVFSTRNRKLVLGRNVNNSKRPRSAGVRFVYHEYDYRQNWTPRSPITNNKNFNSREKKNSQVMKQRINLH